MKDFNPKDFAALIGIDWADKKHDICELPTVHPVFSFSVISSKPESIHDWAMSLRERYPDKSVAVACELKKGPLINALLKYDHITIFPINPSTVAKYRKAWIPSGAKSDPSDAKLQTEILRDHGNKLSAIEPDSAEVRALAQLVEFRRKLVQDRVDLTNTITAYLKNYFPQVLDWFKEKDTHVFCDFITRWPSLQHARRARKQTLIGFFNQHNARYLAVNQQRIEQIRTATALTEDPGVVEPSRLMIELLTPQLKALLEAIERMDQEIKQRYKAMPDNELFSSFPAAGPQMAPRLMVAFGSNRDRYATAHELQKYSGIAPVIESSGNKTWTHWRYSCPTFLRQTFVEWAGLTVRYSFWARAYYEQQKSKGKPHNTIMRSLAFKWIRIMFKCWKEQTPYDESKYLQALRDRNAPLLKFAVGA
jgi:transposase